MAYKGIQFWLDRGALNEQLDIHHSATSGNPALFAWQLGEFTGVFEVEFAAPYLTFLESGNNRAKIYSNFLFNLNVLQPEPQVIDHLAGYYWIQDKVVVRDLGQTREIGLDFAGGFDATYLSLSSTSQQQINEALQDLNPNAADVMADMLEDLITDALQANIGFFALSGLIPVDPDSNDPFVPKDVEVYVDSPGKLVYLLPTAAGGGSTQSVADNLDLSRQGSDAVAVISDHILLRHVLCPELAEIFGIDEDQFGAPCRLKSSVNYEGATITKLEAVIKNGQFVIEGELKKSGKGWQVTNDFTMTATPKLIEGEIVFEDEITFDKPDVEVKWWVWLLEVLVGGIPALVVTGIFVNVQEKILAGIAKFMGGVLSGKLLPDDIGDEFKTGGGLGPSGATLNPKKIELKEYGFVLSGTMVPISPQGLPQPDPHPNYVMLPLGWRYDLDKSEIYEAPSLASQSLLGGVLPYDLAGGIEHKTLAIYPKNGAKILKVIDSEQSAPSNGSNSGGIVLGNQDFTSEITNEVAFIPYQKIPFGLDIQHSDIWTNLPPEYTGIPDPLTFLVKTNGGRTRRVMVWRDVLNNLYLRHEEVAAPRPEVDSFTIEMKPIWNTTGKDKIGEGVHNWVEARLTKINPGNAESHDNGRVRLERIEREARYEEYAVKGVLHLQIKPRGGIYPFTYHWWIEGTQLCEGEHYITVADDVRLNYELFGHSLRVFPPMGQPVKASLCIEVIDACGRAYSTTRPLEFAGRAIQGGRPITCTDYASQRALADILNALRPFNRLKVQ